MRNRRRSWLLRRLVVGFAVAAMVVPAAAQARPLVSSGVDPVEAQNGGHAVIKGDESKGADSAQAASFTRTAKYGSIYESNLDATPSVVTDVVPGSYGILPAVPSDRHILVGDYGILPVVPSDRLVKPGDYGVLPAVGGDETILVGHPRGGFQAEPSDVSWGVLAAGIGGLGLALAALLAFGGVRSTRRVGRPATA